MRNITYASLLVFVLFCILYVDASIIEMSTTWLVQETQAKDYIS
jgi:hypothetical protein